MRTAGQWFARKPLKVLLDEMAGEHRLRRVLGSVQLSSPGIGAIIGTGIFVLTGVAAHDKTGPALMLSFVVAGLARRSARDPHGQAAGRSGARRPRRPGSRSATGDGARPRPLPEFVEQIRRLADAVERWTEEVDADRGPED